MTPPPTPAVRARPNPALRLVHLTLLGLSLTLRPALGSAGEESPAHLGPEPAIRLARDYLAIRHPDDRRPLVAARYIPPHGDSKSTGFWLIELAPYDPSRPLPAETLTGLLIDAKGSIRERGTRTPVDPDETARIREHAERLGRMMEARKAGKPVTAPPPPAP